jgi:hypothetical protein
MLQDFTENSPGDAWTKGGEGSNAVDRYRHILVHLPDQSLNKLMNRALNEVGDVFEEVESTRERREQRSPRRPFVAHVEATRKVYGGVDTGEPGSVSTPRPLSVILRVARVVDLRGGAPADPHVAIGDTGLDLFRDVLALRD